MDWDIDIKKSLKKIIYSRVFWIIILNLILVTIPISGFYLLRFRDNRSRTMRTYATRDIGNSITSSLEKADSVDLIRNLPIIAPYQRILIVDSEKQVVVYDTKWLTNYKLQSYEYESPVNKFLQNKFGGYSAPTLEQKEIVNRLSKYFMSKTTKLSIINYRYLYFIDHFIVDCTNYSLIVLTDKSDILEETRVHKAYILLITAISFLVGIMVSFLYYLLIIKPLKSLTKIVKNFEVENFPKEYLNRVDEIGILSNSFYQTAKELIDKKNSFKEFTNDILHEIKNPLTAIRNSIELLTQKDTSENQKKNLYNLITNESGRIEKLLYDVREYSILEKKTNKNDFCNPGEVIKKVLLLYSKYNIYSDIECNNNINISESHLVSVITNLLDNAISFSPEPGSVFIKCDSYGLSVTDHGPGIKDENIDKIFLRFFSDRKGKKSLNSGLGLSIVKTLLENSNHQIKVTSNKEETTFYVKFSNIKL